MSSRTWRRYALFGTLALVLVLSAVSGKGWNIAGEPIVAPSPSHSPQVSRAPVQSLPSIALERLQRRDAPAGSEKLAGNIFGAMTWHVPPPPPPPPPIAKPAPPPPPTAPPMPFTFLGRYEDEGVRIIMLVKGDRIYTVSEGDVIDRTYRVERLAGGKLELIYLPLGIKQTVSAGGT
ncbi:hypothetical protein J7E70_22735 [Variovorax paradoxus]|nr:hypothetical protein [Variovorax paradoxus]MBT2303269.1 hypothetical protein [Variovorax paradoxus]